MHRRRRGGKKQQRQHPPSTTATDDDRIRLSVGLFPLLTLRVISPPSRDVILLGIRIRARWHVSKIGGMRNSASRSNLYMGFSAIVYNTANRLWKSAKWEPWKMKWKKLAGNKCVRNEAHAGDFLWNCLRPAIFRWLTIVKCTLVSTCQVSLSTGSLRSFCL